MATVNVLEYGADPNGVDDSTEAFRQALKDGDVVLAPAGRYRLNGAIAGIVEAETIDASGVFSKPPAAPAVTVDDGEVKVELNDAAADASEE